MNDIIYVGLDVHKATVAVAVAEGTHGGEVRQLGSIPNRADHIAKLVEKLGKGGRRLNFCYKAGPCGYGLHRQLTNLGQECMVVAPSLIPIKAGDRVKTDRRDAVVLQDYIHAVTDSEARGVRLTQQIEDLVRNWSMAPVVEALQAMRGVPSSSP